MRGRQCLSFADFVDALHHVHLRKQQSQLDPHFLPQTLGCFKDGGPRQWDIVTTIDNEASFLGRGGGRRSARRCRRRRQSSRKRAHLIIFTKNEQLEAPPCAQQRRQPPGSPAVSSKCPSIAIALGAVSGVLIGWRMLAKNYR